MRDVRADLPVDVRVASAPSAQNMLWNYNYQKRKNQEKAGDVGLDALPTTEIIILDRLQDRIIYNQIHEGERLIIFCSAFGINTLMQYGENTAIDGTFEVLMN